MSGKVLVSLLVSVVLLDVVKVVPTDDASASKKVSRLTSQQEVQNRSEHH